MKFTVGEWQTLAKLFDTPDDPAVLQHRETWGAFLLRHGDLAGAGQQLHAVLSQAHDRNLFSVALAHGELARLAMLQHDGPATLQWSQRAVDVLPALEMSAWVRTFGVSEPKSCCNPVIQPGLASGRNAR